MHIFNKPERKSICPCFTIIIYIQLYYIVQIYVFLLDTVRKNVPWSVTMSGIKSKFNIFSLKKKLFCEIIK